MTALILGDCLGVLRAMPDASVDAVVTDPPYGLGFMGAAWDTTPDGRAFAAWAESWARECLRVLKPGGHMLAFGGTRMFHRLTCGVEDAGFEIRDCLSWLYGTGFPKSLDVSKAIDQARIEDEAAVRAVCRSVRAAMERAGLTSKTIADRLGYHSRLIDHFAARDTDSQPEIASSARWLELVAILPELAAVSPEVARLNARKGDYGEAWNAAEVIGEHGGHLAGLAGERFNAADKSIREPSDAARQWQGWGTALKPAWEPILMARKPLIGTVAANVQAHGTGGLNIDACRIGAAGGTAKCSFPNGPSVTAYGNGLNGACDIVDIGKGRWPANVVLDEAAAAVLDEQSGTLKLRGNKGPSTAHSSTSTSYVGPQHRKSGAEYNYNADTGGASRFFYTSKAGSAERELEDGTRSTHPTVKPVDLMRWLVRLVTPPGGVVLDPFMGSGSTGVACVHEGFRFIGIEREPEYHAIAVKRLEAATRQGRLDL